MLTASQNRALGSPFVTVVAMLDPTAQRVGPLLNQHRELHLVSVACGDRALLFAAPMLSANPFGEFHRRRRDRREFVGRKGEHVGPIGTTR